MITVVFLGAGAVRDWKELDVDLRRETFSGLENDVQCSLIIRAAGSPYMSLHLDLHSRGESGVWRGRRGHGEKQCTQKDLHGCFADL